MRKPVFSTELAYVVAMLLLAIGAAFMTRADIGMSVVIAPAYILYKLINPFFGFFTFGVAEYTFQAVLIIVMVLILKKFRLSFLFSFLTAVLYGWLLDLCMTICPYLPVDFLWQKYVYFAVGAIVGPAGVALMFKTYISPEAYELFVKELADHFSGDLHKFKIGYDCASLVCSIVLNFVAFGFALGFYEGIGVGTLISALCNGFMVSVFTKLYDKVWVFKDKFTLRPFFTGEEPIR